VADPRDDFVVVSVLFVESTSTPSKFLDTLGWDSLPGKGLTREVKDKVNLYHIQGMENNAGGYYSYAGSLSRPPCAEGVRRFVMRQYQDISTIQLSRMRVYYNGNNRKVQPLNGRGVQLQNINAHTDMFNMEVRQIRFRELFSQLYPKRSCNVHVLGAAKGNLGRRYDIAHCQRVDSCSTL